MDHTQLQRWRRLGVTVDQADWLAVTTGRHPSEVWPDWYEITASQLSPTG